MGRVTKTTPTRVTKVITAVTKVTTKVTTRVTTRLTKTTRVIPVTKVITAVTKVIPRVTRILVEDTKGKIPGGVNTTHPRGAPTRLPIQRDKIKV